MVDVATDVKVIGNSIFIGSVITVRAARCGLGGRVGGGGGYYSVDSDSCIKSIAYYVNKRSAEREYRRFPSQTVPFLYL